MKRRNFALLTIRLMIVWTFLSLGLYLVYPGALERWLMSPQWNHGDFYERGIAALVQVIFTAVVWTSFGLWLLHRAPSLASKIVPNIESEGEIEEILCLVVFGVAGIHLNWYMGGTVWPLSYLMWRLGMPGRVYEDPFYLVTILVSLFLVAKPDVFVRYARRFQKEWTLP